MYRQQQEEDAPKGNMLRDIIFTILAAVALIGLQFVAAGPAKRMWRSFEQRMSIDPVEVKKKEEERLDR